MAKENIAQYIILGYLSHEPFTGYELKKRIEREVSFFWSDISFGQIYPTLAKLEKEGLATKEVELREDSPPRKIYTITDKGRNVFREWLLKPVAKEQIKYEILLKLFFGGQIPVEANIKRIQEFRERSSHNVELMTHYAENLRQVLHDEDHLYFLLVVLLGKHFYKSQVEWSDEALHLLQSQNLQGFPKP